jgi:competence protein ComEC
MALKLLFLITYSLFDYTSHNKGFFKYKKPLIKKEYSDKWNKNLSALSDGTQIGHKRSLSKKLKRSLKTFGLLHLLTPSGIHLSSFLIFLRFFIPTKILSTFIFLLGLILTFYDGFHSIRRICYFFGIKALIKDNKKCFILTFLFEILLGGFLKSPLSFTYSLLFWGVIIFSPPKKLHIIINLFLAQLFCAAINNDSISLMSIFINPIVTTIFSLLFPIVVIIYWSNLQFFNDIFNFYFYKSFEKILNLLINYFDFLTIQGSFLALMIIYFALIKKRAYLIFLVLYTYNLNPNNHKVTNTNYFLANDSNCKTIFRPFGITKKCYKKDIKKALKNEGLYKN